MSTQGLRKSHHHMLELKLGGGVRKVYKRNRKEVGEGIINEQKREKGIKKKK